MADIKDWMALAEPNAEWEAAVKQMGQRPNLGLFPSIGMLRQYMSDSKKAMTASAEPISGVKEEDHQVKTRDGSSITVRVHSPENKSGCPVFVIFHGGGWCIGGIENEELLARRAAGILGCIVVNVDYRLAPEHQFPTAVHDCHDAVKWTVANATLMGADLSKGFVVGGTSAGGNLATVVALLCRDEKLNPPITGCHLMIPALCAATAIPEQYKADYRSWDQNEHADILSRRACDLFSSNYAPSATDLSSQLFSPLLWDTGFDKFPPSYFQVCGADPLRDEALIFERILRTDQKVKTKVDTYQGLPHGFISIIPTLQCSKQYTNDSLSGLKWLLELV